MLYIKFPVKITKLWKIRSSLENGPYRETPAVFEPIMVLRFCYGKPLGKCPIVPRYSFGESFLTS